MTDRASGSGSLFNMFILVACLALAALVVLLALQNRRLEADLEEMAGKLAVAEVGKGKDLLGEGDLFPPVELLDAESGANVGLAFDGGGAPRSMLMIFSHDCPACQETIPLWEEAMHGGDEPGIDIVAVRVGPPGDEVHHDAHPGLPVYDPLDSASMPLDQIIIPATFVVDAHGFIERAWYGVPSDRQLGEIESLIFP